MLIALLALLGVDLAALLALAAFVRTRKRWVKRQPGAFRVADGEIDGLHPKWRRGYGRWVRDVLVWTKGPFRFRNDLVVADDLQEHRPARPGEVKRLKLLVGPYRELLGSAVVAAPVRTGPTERP